MSLHRTDRKTRNLIRLGWLAALIISAWAVLSPWGAVRYYRISKKLEKTEASNAVLREKNRQLEKEIDLLTNDPAYIEDIARKKYGLLRSNEFVYQFPAEKKK
jgi:cell division protein FtsB